MRNLIPLTIVILIFSGCDPVSEMEANIENQTSQNLTFDFISSDESLRKTLRISPNEIALFQEGFDIGGTYLEPSLADYDSVVVRNQVDMILKVYKEESTGKNIYNIKEYWEASKPSKRFFEYEYEIDDEDIN